MPDINAWEAWDTSDEYKKARKEWEDKVKALKAQASIPPQPSRPSKSYSPLKSKKGLLTVPPELQEYLSKKARGIKQFAPEMEDWGKLSPEKTWEYWKQTDPQRLYMIQLKDLLWQDYQLYFTGGDVTILTDKNGNAFRDTTRTVKRGGYDVEMEYTAQEQAEERIDEILKGAQDKIDSGFYPLESLPFYEESKDVVKGPNFNREYQNLLVDEMTKAQKLATVRQKMLSSVGSPEGRQALKEYTSVIETQHLQDQLNRGEITQEEAYTRTAELNKQAYGAGSEWERWQRGLSGQQRVDAPGTLAGALGETIGGQKVAASNEATRVGEAAKVVALNPEWYKKFLMTPEGSAAVGSANPAPSRGIEGLYAGAPGTSMLGNAFAGNAEAKTSIGSLVGSQALSGSGLAAVMFKQWLQDNPEYQKEQQTKIAGYMQDYPGFYPKYQQYLGQETTPAEGWQGFEGWAQQQPEYLLLQEQKRQAAIAAKSRLAPPTVNR